MKRDQEIFIEHCRWAYEYWQMHELMCDYDVNDSGGIWSRIGIALHEYTILQIAKINDPKESGRDTNLSLEYFVTKYAPTKSFRKRYENFRTQNRNFIDAIRTARHKTVAHSDLETIRLGNVVGAFAKGEDKEYFDSLHNIISGVLDYLNLPTLAEWPEFIVEDTNQFMQLLQTNWHNHHLSPSE